MTLSFVCRHCADAHRDAGCRAQGEQAASSHPEGTDVPVAAGEAPVLCGVPAAGSTGLNLLSSLPVAKAAAPQPAGG